MAAPRYLITLIPVNVDQSPTVDSATVQVCSTRAHERARRIDQVIRGFRGTGSARGHQQLLPVGDFSPPSHVAVDTAHVRCMSSNPPPTYEEVIQSDTMYTGHQEIIPDLSSAAVRDLSQSERDRRVESRRIADLIHRFEHDSDED